MLGNGNFILLYSKVPKYPARSGTPPYNQRATIWSLELGNIRGIWKKLIESEKFFTKYEKNTSNTGKWVINSTKLKGVERPHPQWGIPITIKNRQIGPHNWKRVKNYENNQDYTTRAAAYHFQYNLKQVSIPVPKNAPPKSPNDKFNVVPSLEKLCLAVVARNDHANLRPILNKGAGGASLNIFVTYCRCTTEPQN